MNDESTCRCTQMGTSGGLAWPRRNPWPCTLHPLYFSPDGAGVHRRVQVAMPGPTATPGPLHSILSNFLLKATPEQIYTDGYIRWSVA